MGIKYSSPAAGTPQATPQKPVVTPLLIKQTQRIGSLRAEADALRLQLGVSTPCSLASPSPDRPIERIFEQFLVIGAGETATEAVSAASEQVWAAGGWWRSAAQRRQFTLLAQQGMGPATLLSVYPPCADDERLAQIKAQCFPDTEGSGAFVLTEHSGVTPEGPGLELDYSTFLMSDERGRLYGACVRTHEVIWSSDQASRCWCAPRVYCLLSRLPCFSALFSILLAAIQEVCQEAWL